MQEKRSGRRLVVGDVHGARKALDQALERAAFDPAQDELVFLGDLVDGWPDSAAVLDFVGSLPHWQLVLGNHDIWALHWLAGKGVVPAWLGYGGWATIHSLVRAAGGTPSRSVPALPEAIRLHYLAILRQAKPYIVIDDDLFVHAGVDRSRSLLMQDEQTLFWERKIVLEALNGEGGFPPVPISTRKLRVLEFRRIFVGHTQVTFDNFRPVFRDGVWLLDQGAGWDGKLTVMDIATEEYWQSDLVSSLYPQESWPWNQG
jgi:serine/threonine protein phosphatase 1